MAWFLSSGCAPYTPSHGAMRTNAPTVPPLVDDPGSGQDRVLATGGLRVQQTMVEHIFETNEELPKDGLWTTSPVGGWGQLQWVPGDGGARASVGGEYGAGWSAWLGLGGVWPIRGSSVVDGASLVLGFSRRQTRYWDDSITLYTRRIDGWDTTGYVWKTQPGGFRVWTRLGFSMQRRESGPWGEISWVPLYSWGGEVLDGYFSTMGSLALGWHQPVGSLDRIVVGWRGLATGYTMSNQGMLLWQHSFMWGESSRPN